MDQSTAVDRTKLPRTLATWRVGGYSSANTVAMWDAVRPAFEQAGIELWRYDGTYQRVDPKHTLISSGFACGTRLRAEKRSFDFREFSCHNASTWVATTKEDHIVVVRPVVMADEGKEHMRILREFSRGPVSVMTDNHILPLWGEVSIEDITFSISPFVTYSLEDCYGTYSWAQNSVGDIVDMILQAIEGLAFIHEHGIAHRDIHRANFLVPWFPESLATKTVPACRPRVYLIDFEFAHQFAADVPESERLSVGCPFEGYKIETPPEVSSGQRYDPFKVDVWQLANGFVDFQSTIADIDVILEQMRDPDPSSRLTAVDSYTALAKVVHAIPPVKLLIAPLILEHDLDCISTGGP